MLHRAIVKHDSMSLLFVSYSAVLIRLMDKHWAPIVTMKVPDIAGTFYLYCKSLPVVKYEQCEMESGYARTMFR